VADNNEEMDRFFQWLRSNADAGENSNKSLNDLEKTVKQVSKGIHSYSKVLDDLDEATKDVTDATDKEKKSKTNLTLATEQLAALTRRFGSALYSSEQGVGKYGGAVEGVTDTIAEMTSKLGALGVVAGELIKVFGALVALGLKNNDEFLNTYNTLSDAGIRFTDSFNSATGKFSNSMLDLKNNTGASTENLNFFAQTLKSIAPDISAFGGGVTNAGQNFKEVVKGLFTDQNLLDFKALGVTEQEMIKIAGQYISNQTKFGKLESNNIADVTAKTKEYIENLTELSQITGQSKDAAQQKIQEQQASLDFQLYLQKLRDSGPNGPELAKRASMAMLLMQEKVGTTMSAAAMSLIANGGRATTELAANYQRILGPTLESFGNIVHGSGDAIKDMNNVLQTRTLPALQANYRAYGATAAASNEAGAQLGVTLQALEAANKLQYNASVTVAEAKLEEAKRSKDPKVIEAAEQRLKEIKDQGRANSAAASTFETSMKVIGKFTDILDTASWGLAKFVKFITFGKVDFTDLWRTIKSTEDANTIINEEAQRKKELEKEQNELQDKYNQKLKEKTDTLAEERSYGYGPGKREYDKDVETFNKALDGIRESQRDNELALYKSNQLVDKANEFLALDKAKKDLEKKNAEDKNKPVTVTIKPSESSKMSAEDFVKSLGIPVSPHGGTRTKEEQQAQLDQWEKGGRKGRKPATPGTSKHESGDAVDIPEAGRTKENIAKLEAAGFKQTLPTEPWHYEWVNRPKTNETSTPLNLTPKDNNPQPSAPVAPLVNPIDNSIKNKGFSHEEIHNLLQDATKQLNKNKNKESLSPKEEIVGWADINETLYSLGNKLDTLIDVNEKMSVAIG